MRSSHGQIVLDAAGEIVLWNTWMEEASGVSSTQALGRSLDDVFPELPERVGDSISKSLGTGMTSVLSRTLLPHPFPLSNRQFRDRTMHQSVTVSSIQVADGGRFALINIVDVSREAQREAVLRQQAIDLQKSSADLEAANAELETFTHMVSHDLRAPLRAVTRFSEFLVEDLGEAPNEHVERDLEAITGGAQRLNDLLDAMLRLVRLDRSNAVIEEFPLSDALDAALLALQESPGWDEVEISRDDLPMIAGDRSLLIQLFQNLIGNATKFIEKKPARIRITAEELDGEMTFGVRDNGIGVDPARSKEIFAPFRRLHSDSEFEGSGIALSICRKVVDRHGGRIWFDPECEGGAHVRFTLPANA